MSNFEFNDNIASKLGQPKGKQMSRRSNFDYTGDFHLRGGKLPNNFVEMPKLPPVEYKAAVGGEEVKSNAISYAESLAIAKSVANAIIYNRKNINLLFKRYGIEVSHLNDNELVKIIDSKMVSDGKFAYDFSSLILNSNKGKGALGGLSNKAVKKHRNFVDAIANAIGGVAGLVGSFVNNSPKAREQQQALMQQQLELARLEKEKEESANRRKIIIYIGLGVSLLAVAGVTVFLVLKNKRK